MYGKDQSNSLILRKLYLWWLERKHRITEWKGTNTSREQRVIIESIICQVKLTESGVQSPMLNKYKTNMLVIILFPGYIPFSK